MVAGAQRAVSGGGQPAFSFVSSRGPLLMEAPHRHLEMCLLGNGKSCHDDSKDCLSRLVKPYFLVVLFRGYSRIKTTAL